MWNFAVPNITWKNCTTEQKNITTIRIARKNTLDMSYILGFLLIYSSLKYKLLNLFYRRRLT